MITITSIRYPKVILVGEHRVLRGGEAWVMPLTQYQARMWGQLEVGDWEESDLKVEVEGNDKEAFSRFLAHIIQESRRMGLFRRGLRGVLKIHNSIPLGAGLGGSAVGVTLFTDLLAQTGEIRSDEQFTMSWQLENLAHSQSSGVDVAGVMQAQPLRYRMNQPIRFWEWIWDDLRWSIHDTHFKGKTKEAVKRVIRLRQENPRSFEEGERLMDQASEKVAMALEFRNSEFLISALKEANRAFSLWGLVNESMELLTADLMKKGALVVKPTGSGLGGHLLAVWPSQPRE